MRVDVLISSSIAVFCITATASAASLSVVEPNGAPATKATAVCVEPASAEPLIVREGRVELPGDCRRVRCDASGFLPGEADVAADAPRCALKPAVAITCEVPAAAAAGPNLEARLLATGSTTPAAKNAVPKAAPGRATTRALLPLVKPGRYTLQVARSDGWNCRADLGPLGAGPRRVAALWRDPVTLSARVKLADGKPAAGVPVRAWSGRLAPRPNGDADVLGAWSCGMDAPASPPTDKDGLAKIVIDLDGDALVVAGDPKDPRGLAYVVVDRAPVDTIVLTLAAPVTVRAKLADEKDRPVACDATLDDLPADIRWLMKVLPGAPAKASCDPQGGVVLGPWPSSPFTLSAVPHPGLPIRVTGEAPAPGAAVDLGTLRVKNGESFRVIVQDELGRPVDKAKVTLRGAAGVLMSVAGTTGDDGGVELSGLPKNASVRFEVKAKGYLPARGEGLELDQSPYIVKLAKGAAIEGSVRDPDGGPIEGASVAMTAGKNEDPDSVATDSRGAFSFDGVDDGAWRLTAKAAGFADSELAPLAVQEHRAVDGLTITLSPAEGISGKVVDSAGSPMTGASVRLVLSQQRDDLERATPIGLAATGGDGTFRIQAAAPADAWLVATKAGFGPCALRPPDRASRGEIVLALTEPASLIVHFGPGAKTAKNVRVRDGAGLGRSAPATAGDMTFTDLAAGRGTVRLERGPEQGVTLIAGQTAEVTLDAAGAVEGRVTFEGAPAPRTFVSVVREEEGGGLSEGGGAFTDERGRFRIDGLAESNYRIVAVGEDGRAETTLLLADGETARVDLALRAVKLIAFVIDGATGKPIAGVHVSAASPGKSCNSSMGSTSWGDPGELGFSITVGSNGCLDTRSDAAGVARLSLSGPGSYDVGVHDDSYESWSQPIALGDGTTTKRIALTRKADKSGEKPKVITNIKTDPPGLPGAAECRWGNNTNSSSPVSGRYECEMAPGPGEVAFHAEGYGRGRLAVTVPQSGELVVDLDVPRGGTLVVPVSQESVSQPAIVDGTGFAWSDGTGNARIPGSLEDLTSGGRGWVFRDVPPGTYAVTVDGKKRAPVPVTPGSTAYAN